MGINNYLFDVAFVPCVTTLTLEQIRALESIGLAYDPCEYPHVGYLQVWCGGLREFALVPTAAVQDALCYEDEADIPKLFFNSVEDLVTALS